MNEYLLEMNHISKSFFDVKVLDDVQLQVKPGEVHILLGENGAGKSTLIKVLSGAYTKNEGEIILDGKRLEHLNPKAALQEGVSVIYQEFNLFPHLPIYENIFAGKERGKGLIVNKKEMIEEAGRYMDKVGLHTDPRTLVGDLSVAQKQLVEIAKSISNKVKILVLDEPTAAITNRETEMLFRVIRELKQEGIGIIYISHRMSEFFEIGDRCTVMRDGKYIDTLDIMHTDEAELTRMMVGKDVSFDKKKNDYVDKGQKVLEVSGLRYKEIVKGISFDLHKSEILGITGLIGSGRTETAKCILGLLKKDEGEVLYKGRPIGSNPAKNISKGIVYLSDDRKEEGLIQIHTLMDNFALPNLDKLARPIIKRKTMVNKTKEYIEKLSIKTSSHLKEARNLSGGNQQKVVIAKWLYADADIYIFNEPTRGIDVGAREEIYKIMESLVAGGASIIMISSDLQEVLKISDRVLIMKDGVINAVKENDSALTQDMVLRYEMQEGEPYEYGKIEQ